MNRGGAAVVLSLVLVAILLGSRSDSATWGRPDEGAYIVENHLDLVIAVVTEVADSGATVGNPPRVRLRVERVLRGRVELGELKARWGFLERSFRCGNESADEKESWERYYATPLKGPTAGERMILAGVRAEDGEWIVSELVRHAHSAELQERIEGSVARLDAEQLAAMTAEARSDSMELAEDGKVRNAANIAMLCARSSDIIVATLEPASHEYHIGTLARLKSTPPDSISRTIDGWLGFGPEKSAGKLFVLPLDREMLHRRFELRMKHLPRNVRQVGTYLLFLKRGPFVYDARVFWPADHHNALMPADSVTIRRVRHELDRHPRTGQPMAPEECGSTLARFLEIPRPDRSKVRAKLISLRPGGYPNRATPLVVGHDLGLFDETFAPCVLPGERYWHNSVMSQYRVEFSSDQMGALLSAVSRMPAVRRGAHDSTPAAAFQLHGPISGSQRVFEVLVGATDLVAIVDAMSAAAGQDTNAVRSIDVWRYNYGEPLTRGSKLFGKTH